MADLEFVEGLHVKAPHEKAPDFVKAQISIKVADLGVWLRAKYKAGEEWVNVDVKVSKGGKWYAAVSTYKKGEQAERKDSPAGAAPAGGGAKPAAKHPAGSFEDMSDDIPF